MPYSFRQDLFEVDGEALCFDVSRCYDADDLKSIIEVSNALVHISELLIFPCHLSNFLKSVKTTRCCRIFLNSRIIEMIVPA